MPQRQQRQVSERLMKQQRQLEERLAREQKDLNKRLKRQSKQLSERLGKEEKYIHKIENQCHCLAKSTNSRCKRSAQEGSKFCHLHQNCETRL